MIGAPRSGAVYVEYVIAIVPLFVLFWGLLQLNGLLLADLVVRDAAAKAVRAAIVCDSDHETTGAAGAFECAQKAAEDTIKAVRSIKDIEVIKIDGASAKGNQPVTATVVANYYCQVPLVAYLVCAAFRGEGQTDAIATIQRQATLPNQGHYYNF